MEKNDGRCVIIAAGDFPVAPHLLRIIQEAEFICACDGAALECLAHNIIPNAVVGDGDSLSACQLPPTTCLHIISEQDDNDLTKATRFCVSKGYKRIDYLGCAGKREDHMIGNVSLIVRYLVELGVDARMHTEYGVFIPAQKRIELKTTIGQQVSIFNFGCKELKSRGLKWDCYAFEYWNQGTLNEALTETISLEGDGNFLVYLLRA